MSTERQQLAAIGDVLGKMDQALDALFRSTAELKTNLGLPGPEVAPVTAPEPPPPQGALETAQALQRALEDMRGDLRDATARLATAEQREQRRWRVVIGLAVSFAFDIILTVVVTIATVQAHTASERANATVAELHSTQISACQSGNQTRAAEVQLWTHLAEISKPAPGSTPAQAKASRREIAQLLAYIRVTFAPRNCAAVYHLKGTR